MKKLKFFIRNCKSLSSQLKGASSCYFSCSEREEQRRETVYVGNSRRRYVIDSKHLRHPLINALIDETNDKGLFVSIKCEVVMFDHLLWMLENADPISLGPDQSLEDLAQLYMF